MQINLGIRLLNSFQIHERVAVKLVLKKS